MSGPMRGLLGSGVALAALALGTTLAPSPAAPAGSLRAPRPVDRLLASPRLRRCHAAELCGSIVVPRYRGRPTAGTFTIHFAVYPHTDRSVPPLEPIVAMEGGPGYPSIGSASTYLTMIGGLHARHDLILMDQRGTGGSDAIDCPGLQDYEALSRPGDYAAVTAACARSLGADAGAYGTAAVADDLAAVLAALHVRKVDVYGDSYGSYAAEVFTVRHAALVRALVLDATFDEQYDPFEPEASAALRSAWDTMCAHFDGCHGGELLGSIASFARRLSAHPITATVRDEYGDLQHVDLTAPAFAQLVFDATYSYTFFRDVPAALVAARHGNLVPIVRLAATDVSYNAGGGSPSAYSAGDLEAVSCHDYPTVWNPRASFPERAAQLRSAIARLRSTVFYPFSKSVWLASMDENELVYGCLRWPRPAAVSPLPRPFPHVPVLVLDGLLDQATPLRDAEQVARAWPDSTFVEVANSNHVTAEDDLLHCVSGIVRRFIATLSAGDTSCARRVPPLYVTPAFPTHLADAPESGRLGGNPTRLDRQAAWVAGETVGEAFEQWYNLGLPGYGLYGGTFTLGGRHVTIHFHAVRFVADMTLSGSATWDEATSELRAEVTLGGGRITGTLALAWQTGETGAVATEVGTLAGRPVSLRMAATFSPQG